MFFRHFLTVALLACAFNVAALAPASHFSDHMVLQRGVEVPIWGKADAGAKVTVSFAGQTVSTQTGKDGNWRLTLKPLKASAKDRELTISSGGKKKVMKNVLVGEVW
ncbi:MAG: hypothetical protein ACPGVU_02480, partial [Limisphaerales bacterium]